MLDLKKLEEQLDRALEKETVESLSLWLNQKRSRAFLAQLGIGDFEKIKPVKNTFVIINIDTKVENSNNSTSIFTSNRSFVMAA